MENSVSTPIKLSLLKSLNNENINAKDVVYKVNAVLFNNNSPEFELLIIFYSISPDTVV